MKMRLIYLAVGLTTGVVGSLLVQRACRVDRESACNADSQVKLSPAGDFRATLTQKTCGWGFGLAANFSSVKLEKLGPNGWYQNVELETDQPVAESPTMEWTDPGHLEVVIKSTHRTGADDLKEDALRFTRRYVKAR